MHITSQLSNLFTAINEMYLRGDSNVDYLYSYSYPGNKPCLENLGAVFEGADSEADRVLDLLSALSKTRSLGGAFSEERGCRQM